MADDYLRRTIQLDYYRIERPAPSDADGATAGRAGPNTSLRGPIATFADAGLAWHKRDAQAPSSGSDRRQGCRAPPSY
jgi:hypothetical protein